MDRPRHHPPANGRPQQYRRTWAHRITDRATQTGDIPLYGSEEWARLPADDPRKAAAAIRAAEAWARLGDDLEHTTRQDLYDLQRADDQHWADIYAGRHDTSRAVITRMDTVRARTTRTAPTDYTGGPVPWEGTTQ